MQNFETALHAACAEGRLEIVKELCYRGGKTLMYIMDMVFRRSMCLGTLCARACVCIGFGACERSDVEEM
jgi:hypothetical protein